MKNNRKKKHFTRFYRVGIAILVLHDLSDILFDIAKLFVYTEKEFLGMFYKKKVIK